MSTLNGRMNEFYSCDRKEQKNLFNDKYPVFGVLGVFMEASRWITRYCWKFGSMFVDEKKEVCGIVWEPNPTL